MHFGGHKKFIFVISESFGKLKKKTPHFNWSCETIFNGASTAADTNIWDAGWLMYINKGYCWSFSSMKRVMAATSWQCFWWERLQESTNNHFLSVLRFLLTLHIHSSFAIKPNGIWVSWWFSRLKEYKPYSCGTKSCSHVLHVFCLSFLWPPHLLFALHQNSLTTQKCQKK